MITVQVVKRLTEVKAPAKKMQGMTT